MYVFISIVDTESARINIVHTSNENNKYIEL